jgi:membrane protein DedA with SNARE-associated domain
MPILLTDQVAWILFLWVLVNQAGVPLPVVPALLGAGALARTHLELMTIMIVVVAAALCADAAWYSLGRWRGGEALAPLRRRFTWVKRHLDGATGISVSHGIVLLMGARFVPELNPVVAGVAGATRATPGRYFLCATASALIWAGTWTGLGHVLGAALARHWA